MKRGASEKKPGVVAYCISILQAEFPYYQTDGRDMFWFKVANGKIASVLVFPQDPKI